VKSYAVILFLPLALVACTPTVKLEAPDKPIEINLNVKIEHEVRVSIAKDVSDAIAKDPSLF
jgi:hypothetical protein